MPTLQETFDAVVAHARRQKCKSIGLDGGCEYRAPNGRQCFVGALIPDEMYSPHMERKEATATEVCVVLNKLGHDVGFARRLQQVHDMLPPDEWEQEFRLVAFEFQLRYTPPEETRE